MSGFNVKQPGLLSLLHDRGRYGAHKLGLTTGGPLDFSAFDWANRLLGNDTNATCLEVSFGGLQLQADTDTSFVITGATAPCKHNGVAIEQWQTLDIKKGDELEIGFASAGTRIYLAVLGGFDISPSFGSSSTVLREKIGGLNGDKLQANDHLPCPAASWLNIAICLNRSARCMATSAALQSRPRLPAGRIRYATTMAFFQFRIPADRSL